MTSYNSLNDEVHNLCSAVAHGCYDWLQVDDGGVLPDTVADAAKAWAAMQYAGCSMYGEIAVYATHAALAASGCQISGDGMQYLSLLCELAQEVHANSTPNRQPQTEAGRLPEWPDPADVAHLQTCWTL